MTKPIIDKIGEIVGKEGKGDDIDALSEFDDQAQREEERFGVTKTSRAPEVFLSFPGAHQIYRVVDISLQGLAFETEEPVNAEYLERELEVLIHLGKRRIPLRIKPVNAAGVRVGCRIERFPPKWSRDFARFINPLQLGGKLQPMQQPPAPVDKEGNRLVWYHAPLACDLFVWINSHNQFVAAQLLLAEHLVEWTCDRGLATALVRVPPRLDEHFDRYSVTTYGRPAQPNAEVLAYARRLLHNAPAVPDAVRHLFEPT